jgi:hypothetical protein
LVFADLRRPSLKETLPQNAFSRRKATPIQELGKRDKKNKKSLKKSGKFLAFPAPFYLLLKRDFSLRFDYEIALSNNSPASSISESRTEV